MSGFMYFVSEATTADFASGGVVNQSRMLASGLGITLTDCRKSPDHLVVADVPGPAGQSGVLLVPVPVSGDLPKLLRCDASQTWRSRAGGKLWIGWATESPPSPADLERRETIGGYLVTDAVDRQWQVPVLRAVDNPRGRLTPCFTWDDDDRPVMGVDRKLAALWVDSARAWDMIDKNSAETGATLGQGFTAADDAWLFDYLVRALSINYRVGNRELAALDAIAPGWLNQSTASVMVNATVDMFKWKTFLAAQKKTPSPSTVDGVTGGSGFAD